MSHVNLLCNRGIAQPSGQRADLVFAGCNGVCESKEGKGQIDKSILIALQVLVILDNLVELQAH